jgi:hypothetical protein
MVYVFGLCLLILSLVMWMLTRLVVPIYQSTMCDCSFNGTTSTSWPMKKQIAVSQSSTKVEYKALYITTASDLLWVSYIGYPVSTHLLLPTSLLDNQHLIQPSMPEPSILTYLIIFSMIWSFVALFMLPLCLLLTS